MTRAFFARVRIRYVALVVVVFISTAAIAIWGLLSPERRNVLLAHGEPEVVVMNFADPFPFDPLPAGWYHRTFWTRKAASFTFATQVGVPALRCETQSSASMLFRHADIDLVTYPILEWRWFIEKPIVSEVDERTREGDDHPARLFITFIAANGEERNIEIIWGNQLLKSGDYKYIDTFPHYVANGGADNVGQWHRERIDLLAIYRHLWPGTGAARVVDIAIFCDSDDTATASIAYFADIR